VTSTVRLADSGRAVGYNMPVMSRISALLGLYAAVWAGLVGGVSFVAAPALFRAGSITRERGIDAVSAIFSVFSLIEALLASGLIVLALVARPVPVLVWFLVAAVVAIVAVENLVLMPAMAERTALVVSGADLPASSMHLYFVMAEAAKAAMLLALPVALLVWRPRP